MASDLTMVRLDQIAQINPRRSVKKGSDISFIDMAAIAENRRHIDAANISKRLAKAAGSHFSNGDTLLARITPCLENGKTAQVNCLEKEEIAEGSTEFIVLCGIDRQDDDFVYYLCRDQAFREYAIGRMEGTSGRQRVSWQSIANYAFLVPPKNERIQIAETLSSLDDRITLLRDTNKTLEAIAQAIFKSWFIDFDPVRAKMEGRAPAGMDEETAALFPDELVESELGVVPEGWSVQGLDQIATYLNGLALQKFPPTGNDDLPVIKIAQLRKGDTIGADKASRAMKPEYIVKDGDVLFSWSGSLEVEIWCGGEGALNQHLFKVTSEKFSKWFYYLWTRKHLEHFRHVAASKATTMGHIQRSHLSDAKVVVPDEKLLAVAYELFSPLIDRITANSLQAKTLAETRDTLLPRLISGKLSCDSL